MLACSAVLLALFASAQGRAVNISNTWVLPEEGFPVFYRYFRDRISWYEADAVCQFHHANLVTVDTTAQYDAVRAYLKELDISSAVWVGLIRSNPYGEFTWTDFCGLRGDGYWSSAPPETGIAPLCAAADPAADYRWEARSCGGPSVASFICELPVPQWALGDQGCMVRALPALTALYLPESAAVQLTADCGFAGTKQVQCTGNVKREDLLRNLSCTEDEDLSSTPEVISIGTTWLATTDTAASADQDSTTDVTTEESITTDHISEEPITSLKTTPAPVFTMEPIKMPSKQEIIINKLNDLYSQQHSNLDLIHNNNLQSNDIPKIAYNENFLTVEQTEKLEDEKHMNHKMLHDELARHGNFETIFTQPTDHFVPPLVMAKARISDDMTVLSLAEKHAQQLAEQGFAKHNNQHGDYLHVQNSKIKVTTEEPNNIDIIDKPLVMVLQPMVKDNGKKDKTKPGLPKKYKDKSDDPKLKNLKMIDNKLMKFEKTSDVSTQTELSSKMTTTSRPITTTETNKLEDESSMDLTVMLKELGMEDSRVPHYSNHSNNVPKVELIRNDSSVNKQDADVTTTDKAKTIYEMVTERQSIPMNHEIIKITIINDDKHTSSPVTTVFEVTTRTPKLKEDIDSNKFSTSTHQPIERISTSPSVSITDEITVNRVNNTSASSEQTDTTSSGTETTSINAFATTSPNIHLIEKNNSHTENLSFTEQLIITEAPIKISTLPPSYATNDIEKHNNETVTTSANITYSTITDKIETAHIDSVDENTNNPTADEVGTIVNTQHNQHEEITTASVDLDYNVTEEKDTFNYTGSHEDYAKNWTDSLEEIDDFQSSLLSAANEPIHRPHRSRRPAQPPSRLHKFNPFRILG